MVEPRLSDSVSIDALLACLDPALPLSALALPEAVRSHIEGLLEAREALDRLLDVLDGVSVSGFAAQTHAFYEAWQYAREALDG